jgi:hypothetical protein
MIEKPLQINKKIPEDLRNPERREGRATKILIQMFLPLETIFNQQNPKLAIHI